MVEKLYTPEEVAALLQISVNTVLHFLRNERLPGIKIGREWRVPDSVLQAHIDRLKSGFHYTAKTKKRPDGTWEGVIYRSEGDLTRRPGEHSASLEKFGPETGKTRQEVLKKLKPKLEELKKEMERTPRPGVTGPDFDENDE